MLLVADVLVGFGCGGGSGSGSGDKAACQALADAKGENAEIHVDLLKRSRRPSWWFRLGGFYALPRIFALYSRTWMRPIRRAALVP